MGSEEGERARCQSESESEGSLEEEKVDRLRTTVGTTVSKYYYIMLVVPYIFSGFDILNYII